MTRKPTEPDDAAAAAGFVVGGVRLPARRPGPGLYPVATPIGNLEDVTLRALRLLAAADLVYCEDTRLTRRLLDRYGIARPLRAYHEHNAEAARGDILQALGSGGSVVLVSDAGTPLISDPGYKLVREAAAAGHAVVPVPGPSALLAAAVASGLPTDRLHFVGFLPPRPAARRKAVAALKPVSATLILYEAPGRAAACLADLARLLGPRPAALCRELTKLHEETARGDLESLAARYADVPPRGEVVIVVAGAEEEEGRLAEDELDAMLAAELDRASLRDAVDAVAARSGHKRKDVYARALAIGGRRD